MKILLTNLFLSILFLGIYGCYPKGPEYIQELDLVLTQYAPDYDFGAQNTYFMPDSISWQTNDRNFVPDESFEREVLKQIESQMNARGYTRLDSIADTTDLQNPNNPDMVMIVTGIYSENTGGGWVPVGGCWWYPCWGWGGWYGGWVPYTYSFTTGTVVMDLGDFREGDEITRTFPLSWEGLMNGLAGSSSSSNQDRIESGINQAFLQSPYLQSNQ